jgi:hypothetical protein
MRRRGKRAIYLPVADLRAGPVMTIMLAKIAGWLGRWVKPPRLPLQPLPLARPCARIPPGAAASARSEPIAPEGKRAIGEGREVSSNSGSPIGALKGHRREGEPRSPEFDDAARVLQILNGVRDGLLKSPFTREDFDKYTKPYVAAGYHADVEFAWLTLIQASDVVEKD